MCVCKRALCDVCDFLPPFKHSSFRFAYAFDKLLWIRLFQRQTIDLSYFVRISILRTLQTIANHFNLFTRARYFQTSFPPKLQNWNEIATDFYVTAKYVWYGLWFSGGRAYTVIIIGEMIRLENLNTSRKNHTQK